jgi:two-component system, NarL family, response regulator YdfI
VIRVAVEAPDVLTRDGLEALMSSSPGLILAADDPDVLLAALPIEELETGAPIVLLGEPVWTSEALRLGVRAMLPPDASSDEIVAAVHAAATGLAVVDPKDLEAWLPRPTQADTAKLTHRELEVLRMMAEGAANKNIAWKLGISEHTAKFHVASILGKLNAGTRAEAVAVGVKRGLILL